MEEWQNGRMAEISRMNGRMVEWQNGKMVEWQNGRMVKWQMVEWWNGRMVESVFESLNKPIFH